MRIRLAKPDDHKRFAHLHFASRDKLDSGFFSKSSMSFLRYYYKFMLNDPNYVALCAEDNSGQILGFVTASLNASIQFQRMREHRLAFAIILIPSFLKNPKLLYEAASRYISTKDNSKQKYINIDGPRGEYWVWDSHAKNSAWSLILYRAHLEVLRAMKVRKLHIEVDTENKNIFKFHVRNGAIEIESYQLPDGRQRQLMFYEL